MYTLVTIPYIDPANDTNKALDTDANRSTTIQGSGFSFTGRGLGGFAGGTSATAYIGLSDTNWLFVACTWQNSYNTRSVYNKVGTNVRGTYSQVLSNSDYGGSRQTFLSVQDPTANSQVYSLAASSVSGYESNSCADIIMSGFTDSLNVNAEHQTKLLLTSSKSQKPSHGLTYASISDSIGFTQYDWNGWGAQVGTVFTSNWYGHCNIKFMSASMEYSVNVAKSGSNYEVSLSNLLVSNSTIITSSDITSTNKYKTSATIASGETAVLGRVKAGGNSNLYAIYRDDSDSGADTIIFGGQQINVTADKLATPSIVGINSSRILEWTAVANASAYNVYIDQQISPNYTVTTNTVTLSNDQYYGAHTVYVKAIGSLTPNFIKTDYYSRVDAVDTSSVYAKNVLVKEYWQFEVDSGFASDTYHGYLDCPNNIAITRTGVNSVKMTWDTQTEAASYSYRVGDGDWISTTATSAEITDLHYAVKDSKIIGDHVFYLKGYCLYSDEFGLTAMANTIIPKIGTPSDVSWSDSDSGDTDSAPNSGTLSFTMPEYANNYIIYVDNVAYYDSGA